MVEVSTLFVMQFFLLLIALYKTKFNVGIPSNIMMCFLLVGYLFYSLGYETWNNPIKMNTILVIMIGYVIAFFASLLAKNITTPNTKETVFYYSKDLKNETNVKVLFYISLIFLVLYAMGIFLAGKSVGLSFASAIAYVKSIGGEGVNIIFRQGFKVVAMASYIACFLLIYDMKNKFYSNKTRMKIIIMIIFGMIITILSGSRGDLLKFISALICIYFLFFSFREKNTKKIIRYFVLVAVSIIIVFYLSRTIVKTFSTEYSGSLSFIDYINYYFGSSYEVLNQKLQCLSSYHSNYFGYNTFFGFYSILSDLGININCEITGKEFVYLGNYDFGGNVSTYYFSLMADFGYTGLIIMVALKCFLGNEIYFRLTKKKSKFAIIYCAQLYSIFTFSFYGGVLAYYIDMTAFFNLIVLIVLYFLTFKLKIR